MNDRVFQPLNAFFDAFDLGLYQVAKIIETLVHRVLEVVDTAILEENAKYVTTYNHGDRTALGELVHWFLDSF